MKNRKRITWIIYIIGLLLLLGIFYSLGFDPLDSKDLLGTLILIFGPIIYSVFFLGIYLIIRPSIDKENRNRLIPLGCILLLILFIGFMIQFV